jgi:hypothetical protein
MGLIKPDAQTPEVGEMRSWLDERVLNYPIARVYESRSRWHRLRTFGTSPIVRLAIFVPIAGYLILLNHETLYRADIDIRLHWISDDGPWRLYFFYLATCFLGAASVLFAWKCPLTIKNYGSALEFIKQEAHFFGIHHHSSPLYDLLFRETLSLARWKRAMPELSRLDDVVKASLQSGFVKSDAVEAMTMYWHVKDLTGSISRIVCRVLYDIGIFLLLIPAVVTFAEVSIYLLNRSIESLLPLAMGF